MILTSAMILPVGLSYAAVSNGTMTNQTSSNGTMAMSSNQTGMMNKTMTMPPSNSTVPQSNDTQAAMQVSTFIHQAVADFTQQGDDTRKVMLDCRDKVLAAAPSDIDKIKQDCSLQLNTLTAKYQDERTHYHDLIKQYRQSVMVFLNDARGHSVPQTTMNSAISQLAMMMHPAPAVTTPGYAATTNNTKCVNPPGGPAIC
jgi:hypothetical protein